VSTAVASGSGTKVVGLLAASQAGTALEATVITSYDAGAALYGGATASCPMTELLRLLFLNGAAAVVAVPAAVGRAATTAELTAGLAVLAAQETVQLIVCGSDDADVHAAILTAITAADAVREDRIAVLGKNTGAVSALTAAAAALNSERAVLVGPRPLDASGSALSGFYLAAAVAGAIAGETDPAIPLGGAAVKGFGGLETRYGEGELDTLIRGGVTAVEAVSGGISVVRGVTTRTTTAGAADTTWRELTTVLIVDDVIPAVRESLRARFARSKNTALTRSAVRSRVIMLLEDKKDREIIEDYSGVTVAADTADPTVCVVDFSFTVAHGLNQIHIYAHITV